MRARPWPGTGARLDSVASPSEHLDAWMAIWKLEREFGGMATVCTQRAGLFARRYGRAFVVTFNRAPDQPQVVAR